MKGLKHAPTWVIEYDSFVFPLLKSAGDITGYLHIYVCKYFIKNHIIENKIFLKESFSNSCDCRCSLRPGNAATAGCIH